MPETSNKNPVEQCLMGLKSRWETFRSDPSKRLLVWRVQNDAVRILQCFLEVQKHDTEYTTGDLFFVFEPPFEHSIQYSRELKESIAGQYEASTKDIKIQGLPIDWEAAPNEHADSATGFIRNLCSFGSK